MADDQKGSERQSKVAAATTAADEKFLEGIENEELKMVLHRIFSRDPDQIEFHDAVKEVVTSLQPIFTQHPELIPILAQMCEPERQIIFRVPWLDDNNHLQINRGFRVQFSSAIGPYKGGVRFNPSVNLSVIKMLGFEQIFKNALTGLSLGAGKGGADFDPKGRSDGEIQRFCQSYMTELYRHISEDIDVPAGDQGVGSKEIGFMFGQYKRLTGRFQGVLTGKGKGFGGSVCRPEATGYGVVFLAEELARDRHGGGGGGGGGEKKNENEEAASSSSLLQGARCLVSGAGNVARFCAFKLVESGAVVLSMSDSKGTVVEPNGFTKEQLLHVNHIKSTHSGSLTEYSSPTAKYFGGGAKPWTLEEVGNNIMLAFPCATQNELDDRDAAALVKKGCWAVIEGANMPVTADAISLLSSKNVIHIPGKIANAGGVAVSGLEMAQNRSMMTWEGAEVYGKLHEIMKKVYRTAKETAEEYDVDLAAGANIAAFFKVSDAVVAQGAV